MVKPYSSKRKLFNNSREQKENEPNQLAENIAGSKQETNIQENQQKNLKGRTLKGSLISEDGRKLDVGQLEKQQSTEDVDSPGLPKPIMPMSERQQIALLMQMSSPSSPACPDYIEKTSNTPTVCRSVGKRNERGETLLHVAAIKGDDEKVHQLIQHGCSVNEKDYAGWTPLHEACNRGFAKIVQLLIQAGANVNAKGLDNETPLHDACINNHIQIVKLLLNNGADTDALNRRGKSPLEICRSPKILALIEQSKVSRSEDLARSSSVYSMSRRTPPVNKMEEKSPPVTTSASGTTSSSTVTSASITTTRPDSPRCSASRITSSTKAPEKAVKSSDDRKENEDIYEFKCSKEETPEEKEDKAESTKSEAPSTVESRAEKRPRENDTEDEERKKRRKDDGTEKGNKSNNRGSGSSSKPPTPVPATSESSPVETPPVSTAASVEQKSPGAASVSSPMPSAGETACSEGEDGKSDSVPGAPKVPPLKIVLSSNTTEQETNAQPGSKANSNRHLPYIVSSNEEKETNATEPKEETHAKQEDCLEPPTSEPPPPTSSITSSSTAASTTTIVSKSTFSTASTTVSNSSTSSSSTEKGGTRITRSQRGGASADEPVNAVKVEPKVEDEPPTSTITDIVPPRKRKLKKVPETQPEPNPPAVITEQQPSVTNCYEMFRKIRSQVEARRKMLVPVQPKPPQGFKEYLMNRRTYALHGRDEGSKPPRKPPMGLPQALVELFTEQEQARHKLHWEHLIEREKLVLSVEQEILRVHGRAARALANQIAPFSVCSILKDEEVYNVITPEQEEKDRNARSRYNGRLFISWLQDVDDKWEKIKEAMVLRHHNEAESLHAVQKMGWEWKMKELNVIDGNTPPVIVNDHVPMVSVTDFDLLPEVNP